MRCRICGERAVIYLRAHGLALCEKHFLERFRRETLRIINKYKMFTPADKVMVAVSGGKDSVALAYLLFTEGYDVVAWHLDLGIGAHSARAREAVEALAQHGIPTVIWSLKEMEGESLPEVARRRRAQSPCSFCGTIKRYMMNRAAERLGAGVVATGHNLNDETAVLLGNTLRWDVGYLARQGPKLPAEGGFPARVKPFAFFTEKETGAFALLSGLRFVLGACPFSRGAKSILHKRVLMQIEARSPGTKLRFYREFLRFKEEYLAKGYEPPKLGKCEICGAPTTSRVCAYCRIFNKHEVKEEDRG